MIRRLRTVHRWIFIVLAILLTGAILVSTVYRSTYPSDSIPDSVLDSSRDGNSLDDSGVIQQ